MDETYYIIYTSTYVMENILDNTNSGVYAIKNIANKRVYIGTSSCIRKRLNNHKQLLNMETHFAKDLQEDWISMGESSFEFVLLEECSPEYCSEKEQEYLDKYSQICELYNKQLKSNPAPQKRRGVPKDPDAVRRSAEGNRGKKRTQEQIEKKRAVVGKEYCAVDPEGIVHYFKNLCLFAEENGLNFRNLHAVISGKRATCKGWTSVRALNEKIIGK